MNYSILVLFVTSICFVSPFSSVTILELNAKFGQLNGELSQTWTKLNQMNITDFKKKKSVFRQLDKIVMQILDTDGQMQRTGSGNTIMKLSTIFSGTMELGFNVTNLYVEKHYLNNYFKNLEDIVCYFDDENEEGITNFAETVLANKCNSVVHLIDLLYQHMKNEKVLNLLHQYFESLGHNYFCQEQKSLREMFHDLLNEVFLINFKSHILIQAAYFIKTLFLKDNLQNELSKANQDFKRRNYELLTAINTHMASASSELRRCDPEKHKEGETFLQVTNFLHGYILNKANLNPTGHSCREECEEHTFTKTQACQGNPWCKKQKIPCPKVLNCQYIHSSMKVCSKSLGRDHRRYQYIEFGNGKIFGKKTTCNDVTYLETWNQAFIWKCSYCFCLCDEGPKLFSQRYVNLRPVEADVASNRVVTGVRFAKHNNVIHLQIQEGKLLPYGQIDVESVRWVPPENYNRIDKGIVEGTDYHTITWEQRSFDLSDVVAENGVITGVKFSKTGTTIHLEIETMKFNLTSGKLHPDKHSKKDKLSRKELKLIEPDIPTLCDSAVNVTTGRYVEFINTDPVKDAAQTTVPFFDAQPVTSEVAVPLSGVGVFHKGSEGSGGFIAPRIFTYNFSQHLATSGDEK